MNALQKLRQLTDQIRTSQNGLEVVDAWALAERLCARMPVDATEAARVFKEKDAAGLDALSRAWRARRQRRSRPPSRSPSAR